MKNLVLRLKAIRIEHPLDVLDMLVFHPRLRRGLRLTLYVLVTLLLAREAAATFWLAALPPADEVETTLVAPPARTARQQAQQTPATPPLRVYEGLRTSLLFGRSADLATAGLEAEQAEVRTTLNMTLTGTIIDAAPRAYVRDNLANKTLVVQAGDRLLPAVTVERVERRRLLLSNQGRREELLMQTAELRPYGKSSGLKSATPDPLAYELEANRKETLTITRAEVLTALGNPGELMAQANFIPRVNEEGTREGFTLLNVQHNSFLSKLGLRDGDVLLKLDGIPVVARERILPMMFALQNAPAAELTILRDSTVVALDISVRE
jgi:general secretion pathway protein C